MKAFAVLGFVVVIATIFNCEAEGFPSNSSDADVVNQNYGETDDMDLLGFGNGGGGSGGSGGGGGGSEDSGSKASPDAQAEAIRKINYYRAKHAQAAVTLNPSLAALAQTCANNLRVQDVKVADEALGDDNGPNSPFLCDQELEAMQFFCLGPAGVDDEVLVVSSCIDKWTSLEAVGYPFGPLQRYDVTRRHFTQIIWDSLKTVAIGISTRRTATDDCKVLVAILDPPGNVRNGESERPFLHHIKAPIRLSAVDEEEVSINLN